MTKFNLDLCLFLFIYNYLRDFYSRLMCIIMHIEYIEKYVVKNRTNHPISSISPLRRPQIKQYTASNEGVGFTKRTRTS